MIVQTLLFMGYVLDVDFLATADGIVWLSARPRPSDADIDAAMPAAQAALDAAATAQQAAAQDRADVRAQFVVDRDKLAAIIAEAAWTNTKRDAALKDIAQVARRMLKLLNSIASGL